LRTEFRQQHAHVRPVE